MSATSTNTPDLLDDFSAVEDEFDVDLMACGCRLAPGGSIEFSIDDLVRLYNFDERTLVAFIGAIIDEGKIESKRVHELANQAVRGQLKEKPSRFNPKALGQK